jgi:hypothetical protein
VDQWWTEVEHPTSWIFTFNLHDESRTKQADFSHFCYEPFQKLVTTNLFKSSFFQIYSFLCVALAHWKTLMPRFCQGVLRVFKRFKATHKVSAGGSNQSVLGYIRATKQHINWLAFIDLAHGQLKVAQVRNFNIGYGQNDIPFAQS